MSHDWQANQGGGSPEGSDTVPAPPWPGSAAGSGGPGSGWPPGSGGSDPNGTQFMPPPGHGRPPGGYGPPPPPPPPGYRPPGGYGPSPGYGAPSGGYGPPSYGYAGYPGYGYPGYGYPGTAAPRTDGTAIAALVLAITSFVFCPVVLAIVALCLIPSSRRTISSSGGTVEGLGLLTAAKIVAWINIGLAIVVFVGIVAIAASSPSSSGALAPLL